MKKILLSLFLLVTISASAQLHAYYQKLNTDTLFYWDENRNVKPNNFYFPSLQEYKKQNKGYDLSAVHEVYLRQNDKSKVSRPVLFLRYYAKNIKNIKFYLNENHTNRVVASIALNTEGYQTPAEIKIDSLSSGLDENHLLKLNIDCEPLDRNKMISLIIGDMYLANNSVSKYFSPVSLFQNSPFSNKEDMGKVEKHSFNSFGIFKHFPTDQFEEEYKGTILIDEKAGQNKTLDNSTVSAVVLALVANYPFFKERKLNKSSTIQAASLLMERYKSIPACDFADTLNEFLTNVFKDPHFQIKKNCEIKKTQTPVYSYMIGGKHLVAAVFDDELKQRIPLGSEIIAVNGVKLPDSAYASNTKTEKLLKKEKDAQMVAKIKLNDGSIVDVPYTIKSNYKIPKNFNPPNYSFRFLNDTVSYYRVSKIYPFLQVDFINKLDSINSRKKLVLDMRGNGGGDLIGGAQFASYFINHPFKYCDFFNSRTNAMDSILVDENNSPFHFRSDGKIVILIDENTACAAEILAMTLRNNNKNVSIVGKSHSKGALAFVYEVIIKELGISISTNSLNTGKLFPDRQSLEGKGIYPDLLVRINTIQDLQPYDDKVLRVAISK